MDNMLSFSEKILWWEKKTTCLLWLSKCKLSLLAPSLCQQLVLVLCFHQVLYDNPNYSRILIGSRLWSIERQTHDWHHHYKVFPSVFLKWRKFLRIWKNILWLDERQGTKKSHLGIEQVQEAGRRKKKLFRF